MRTLRLTSSALTLTLLLSTATAGTLFVDANQVTGLNDGSSWSNAFGSLDGLQAALAVAVPGDEIWVAQGTYRPASNGSRTTQFLLLTGVGVYGGFLGSETSLAMRPPFGTAPTILSGDLAGDDGLSQFGENSFHVVNGANTDATAILDGFTITAGNANGGGNNERGAGLFCFSNASPTIQNCRFVANQCLFGGGAGYISNGSAPRFLDCSFENNSGGSFGGAFDMAGAGAVLIDRCRFLGNTAGRAGAVEVFSTTGVLIANSLFVGNTATANGGGGAIWLGSGGNTRVRNCTIAGNSSLVSAVGGIRAGGAPNSTVDNCILWNNTGPGGAMTAANQVTATTLVTYSIVTGGLLGAGNQASDPQFVNAPGGDYATAQASPATDAGDNTKVPVGIVADLAGSGRFIDEPTVADTGVGPAPITDIGAYEFAGNSAGVIVYCTPKTSSAGCIAVIDINNPAGPVSGANDYPIHAESVQGLKNGLLFGGLAGAAAISFNGGILCVNPPLKRGPIVNSGGSAATSCDGSFSTIVNDGNVIPSGLDAGPGNTAWYQYWYRDPQNGAGQLGTALSDAVQLTYQ